MSEEMARTEAIEVLKDIVSKPMLYSNHIIGACRVALASLETDEAYQLEYEKPTTKNNLAVEKTDMIDKSNFSQEQYKTDLQSAYDCGYAQAKNDLGVDAVSRQAVLDIAKASKSNWIDNSILFKRVNALPSVTPQEPRKGHWVGHREHCENLGVIPSGLGAYEWCSNCDCGIDVREWHRNHYNFCPNCGADMREVEE